MKCPYQSRKLIYRPKFNDDKSAENIIEEEITTFADCLLIECPFYHITEHGHKDRCLRTGREIMTEVKL